MISHNSLQELKEIHSSLLSDKTAKISISPDLEASCEKLFKKIWKLSGRQEGFPISIGKQLFFNQYLSHIKPEIRLQALKHIIDKNTHLYLSAAVDAAQAKNEKLVLELLNQLKTFDPDTVSKIEAEDPLSNAIEKFFIQKTLEDWILRGSPKESRADAATKILTYLEDPLESRLTLSSCKLKTLPNIFNGQCFKKTQTVYLENNELTSLPTSFGNLTHLAFLYLENNQLTSLPSNFSELSHLVYLSLNNNHLKLLPENFDKLHNLQNLYLQNNDLEALPENFGELTDLQNLYLQNNHLRGLPESFGNLSQLEFLYLENNQLLTLPYSFGYLFQLRKLNLERNKIKYIFENFGNLIKLVELSLSCNEISLLPFAFSRLAHLENLYLDNNNLESLPEDFSKLSRVRVLYLNDNKLAALPEGFGQLSELIELNLTNNKLMMLSEDFGKLSQLKFLYLTNNQLTYLPEDFGYFPNKLHCLYLENNQLSKLPENFGNLTNLKILYLSNNNLTTLGENFGHLVSLTHLKISSNKLINLPENFTSLTRLEFLDLSFNNLSYLPKTIGHLVKLEKLYLGKNKLTIIPNIFHCFAQMKTLELSGNPMTAGMPATTNWLDFARAPFHPHHLPAAIAFYGTEIPVPPLPGLLGDSSSLTKINIWLNNLNDKMQHYTKEESRTDLKMSVRRFLEAAEANLYFRSAFIGILDEASLSCIDGLTLSLLHLNKVLILSSLDLSKPQEIFSTLSKIFILNKLEEIAKEKIAEAKAIIDAEIAGGRAKTQDEIKFGNHISIQRVEREYLLSYPSHLKDFFDLPIDVVEMRFEFLTRVTPEDIENAKGIIESILTNPQLLHEELLKIEDWQTALKLYNPSRFLDIERSTDESPEEKIPRLVPLSRDCVADTDYRPVDCRFISTLLGIIHLGLGASEKTILATLHELNTLTSSDIRRTIIEEYNKEKESFCPALSTDYNTCIDGNKNLDPLLLLSITKKYCPREL